MDYQELQVLLSGIDFSGFEVWWKSANPSITYQVAQAKAIPAYVDIVTSPYSDGKLTL